MTKEILLNPGTSPRLLAYNHTLSQHIILTLGKDEEEDEKKKKTFDGQREVERVTHAVEENKQEGKRTSCCLL